MRPLSATETQLLQALLLDSVPGVHQLRAQLDAAWVEEDWDCGFAIGVPLVVPKAHVLNRRVPVEAVPSGGGWLLLHVRNGLLQGLEYLTPDGQKSTALPPLSEVSITPEATPRRSLHDGFLGYLGYFCPCCDRPGLPAVLQLVFADDRDIMWVDLLHRDVSVLAALPEPVLAACLRVVDAPSDYGPVELIKARCEQWLLRRNQPINYLPCVCPEGIAGLVAELVPAEAAALRDVPCPDLAFRMLLRAGSPMRSQRAAPITRENMHLYQRLIELFDGDEDILDTVDSD